MILFPNGLDISDQDSVVLGNDLYDPESNLLQTAIEVWVRGAVYGKVANSKSRFIDQWTAILRRSNDTVTIPTDIDAFITLIANRADYLNRSDREREHGITIN